jgi:FkbM family methyltransferase
MAREIAQLIEDGPAPGHSLASSLSWVPYAIFCKIVDSDDCTIRIDLSDYDIDKAFWLKLAPNDRGLSRQLRNFGFREPLNCQCYVKFVGENDTLLDIGANIGFFTILGNDAKRIVCVEPLSDAISLLRENIELNGLSDKCEIVQAAVGPEGEVHLEVNPHMNLSKVVEERTDETVTVRSIPLGELVERYSPNLIRLDVEGFEYDILHGQIPGSVDKVSLEFHHELLGEEKSNGLLKYFEDEGFKVKYFVEDLPLRLYPMLRMLKNTDIFRPLCFISSDIEIEDVRGQISSGRALKYLYLER